MAHLRHLNECEARIRGIHTRKFQERTAQVFLQGVVVEQSLCHSVCRGSFESNNVVISRESSVAAMYSRMNALAEVCPNSESKNHYDYIMRIG